MAKKMKLVPVADLEPGMKLAAAVVSPTGQTLLSSGLLVDETHIAFLKRRGILNVHVAVSGEYGEVDAATYEQTIEKISGLAAEAAVASPESVDVSTIDPGGPQVLLKRMPSEIPPADAPTEQHVDVSNIEKVHGQWKIDRAQREVELAKKHGESYKKVIRALGEPKPISASQKFQPAHLFCEAVKDVTQQVYLEKKLNQNTIDLLSGNIMTEMIARQGMTTLLSRAQAAGQYLLAHMVNVGVYAMYMGIQMQLTSEEIRDLSIGGLLADVGMLALPEEFWVYDRELWKKEREQLSIHPQEGCRMILDCPGASPVWAKLALQHHERLDGSGYPKGLKAHDLDLHTRIIHICDVYSATTADRAYRNAHLPDTALRQIMGKPKLFDRSLVEIFCQLVGFFPEGYVVLLSSGEEAVVLKANPKNVFRPVVRLRKDKNGRPYMPNEQQVIDLTARPDLRIVKIVEDDSVNWV
ncbi:HD domain-containing protein [bacterium]|nr:HD domain-containing protein [bacterium]